MARQQAVPNWREWGCRAAAAIASNAGFNDLPTFNHRVRRAMGVTPGVCRAPRKS